MTGIKLLGFHLMHFTDFKNKMYQFILFFQPFFFLSIVKFMFVMKPNVDQGKYLFAVAILSAWNYVLYSSGSSLVAEKWSGTLEMLLTSRTSLFKIILIKTITNASIGLLSMLITIIYAVFVFGFNLHIHNIFYLSLTIVVLIFSFVALGNILAIVFGLFANVFEYQDLIVYPVAILIGIFYPVDSFPLIIQFFSYIFPMTWIIEGLYLQLQGKADAGMSPLTIGFILSLLYIYLSYFIIKRMEGKFRESNRLGVF
ncbi:ABC transporter permease [Brevibacillus formosus]|uniref:ABC transporter permease n=1 Tax=Brevibacillus formosus TaxID=54913 RepID=UPI0018CD0082|nr:ABC transporter permease [Brevibacillus formosus]MBG9941022.1 hypothetical protein [Brevibacillus formosus]